MPMHRNDDPNPFRGRFLEILPLPFKLTTGERMRAAMGLPSWILRRKRLERSMMALRRELGIAWSICSPADWPGRVQEWDLSAINAELSAYNRYFPIERDLPMDVRTSDFLEGGEAWHPRPLLDAAWILEEFPAEGAGRGSGPSTV